MQNSEIESRLGRSCASGDSQASNRGHEGKVLFSINVCHVQAAQMFSYLLHENTVNCYQVLAFSRVTITSHLYSCKDVIDSAVSVDFMGDDGC